MSPINIFALIRIYTLNVPYVFLEYVKVWKVFFLSGTKKVTSGILYTYGKIVQSYLYYNDKY